MTGPPPRTPTTHRVNNPVLFGSTDVRGDVTGMKGEK